MPGYEELNKSELQKLRAEKAKEYKGYIEKIDTLQALYKSMKAQFAKESHISFLRSGTPEEARVEANQRIIDASVKIQEGILTLDTISRYSTIQRRETCLKEVETLDKAIDTLIGAALSEFDPAVEKYKFFDAIYNSAFCRVLNNIFNFKEMSEADKEHARQAYSQMIPTVEPVEMQEQQTQTPPLTMS